MLAAAILAAGESRRMGAAKALLDYSGKTFLEHLIEATRHPRLGFVRVVLGAKADEIRARVKIDPSFIVVNTDWQQGQLSSIHAVIRSLPPGATDGLMLCPVDHPGISYEIVTKLIAAFDATRAPITLPVYQGRRGHPVIFRADLYGELLAASPEIGARQVVWAHANEVVEVSTEDQGVVVNIDDPITYRKVFGRDAKS